MSYRRRLSRSHSKRMFRRGVARVHPKNFSHVPNPGMRGGVRG